MKKLFRLLSAAFWLLSVFVFILSVSGCGKEKQRELKLVTEPPYPPFEYYIGDQLTGIDIDIMKEIAARLNYDLKIQTISFDMVMKSVISGQADVAMSSISITEERKKNVNFSIPYIHVSQVVIVPAESSIRRIENLKGKVIGVQEGTTGENYARKNYKHVVPFPNIDVATESLGNKKIDALMLDNIPAEDIIAKDQRFRMLPGKLTSESLGIAINKNQHELLKKINGILADMQKKGLISQIVKKHVNHNEKYLKDSVQAVKKLRIGIVPTYPPYESKVNGVFEGIDVDIINNICDELGCIPSFVEISSDTVYQAITDDDVSISISSLTITEERKKKVYFSIPYSEVSQRILVKKQSAFRKKEDLKGKLIGVVTATTSEDQGLLVSTEVERYSEPTLLLEALTKGDVDAIVLDDIIMQQMTMKSDKFRLLPDILIKEEYGIAVSKKEPELLEKINKILRKMKQDGSLARIHSKYIRSSK